MAAVTSTTDRRNAFQDALLRVFDGALASVIFIAPLFMGGRHPVGELVYIALVSLTACLWCFRQALSRDAIWRLSGVELLFLSAVGVLAMQIVPLSQSTLSTIAPLNGELLTLWGADPVRIGNWSTISFMPSATRGQLVVLIAHIMLFLVIVQRIQTPADVQRLLRWIAIAVIGMATLALLQLFAGNGKFLWVYEHPSRTTELAAKGVFANENHLASFLAMGLGAVIAWITKFGAAELPVTSVRANKSRRRSWNQRSVAVDTEYPWQSLALLIGLGIVAFAGLLTFSRGGVLVLAVASAAVTVLLVSSGVLGRRAMGGLVVAMLVVVAALSIFGFDSLTTQMETLSSGSLEQVDPSAARLNLWLADLRAVADSPWLGTGAGSHAEVYPAFLKHHADGRVYTHAESGYVHLLLETGAAGLFLGFVMIGTVLTWAGLAFWRCGRGENENRVTQTCAAVVLAALIANAFHSIGDFVWFIPACMSLTVVLSACACRLWQLSRPARLAPPRVRLIGEIPVSGFTWAIVLIVVGGLGVLMVDNRIGPAFASSSWADFSALRQAEAELGEKIDVDLLMPPLLKTLKHQPDHARSHLRMAALCLQKFEQQQQQSEIPMPLSQIRDAVNVSEFADKQQQDEWINRITGENRRWLEQSLFHSHRAMAICPLQGEAYTLLAEVAFLHGPRAPSASVLLEQALVVRPFDAHVQFAAGRNALLAGDEERNVALWRDAFHGDAEYRRQIILLLGPQLSAEEFLNHFKPTPRQLGELYAFYRDNQLQESTIVLARPLAEHYEQEATTFFGDEAASKWNQAFGYRLMLDEKERALSCISNAVQADPLNYNYHRSLAGQLLANNRYEEAIVEIRWCRQRRTGDAQVENLWAIARRGPRLKEAGMH